MKKILLTIAMMMALVACNSNSDEPEYVIDNIREVIYHDQADYSVLYGAKGKPLQSMKSWGKWVITEDVPVGKPMWLKVIPRESPDRFELHIHDVSEIGAGTTQHGKVTVQSKVIVR